MQLQQVVMILISYFIHFKHARGNMAALRVHLDSYSITHIVYLQ